MTKYRNSLARMGGVLLLAGAFIVAGAANANAALMLFVCNDAACVGGGDTIVTDGGAGDGDLGTAGSIIVNLGGGQIQTAVSYPAAGTPANPFLNLTYRLNQTGGFGPFIYVAQDGFTPPVPFLKFTANESAGSGNAAAFGGAGSFVPTAPFGTGALFGPAPMPISASFAGPLSNPYFLAIGIEITGFTGGVASGDATLFVPEPAMMTLFGLGLLGAGVARRRKQQKQQQLA